MNGYGPSHTPACRRYLLAIMFLTAMAAMVMCIPGSCADETWDPDAAQYGFATAGTTGAYNIVLLPDEEGGTIDLDRTSYGDRETVTVAVTPDHGMKLKNLYYYAVDPEGSGYTGTWISREDSFVMPPCDIYLGAHFEKNRYLIKHDVSTLNVRFNQTWGETVFITVNPPAGQTLILIGIDNVELTEIEKGKKYSFVMPEHDVTVNAQFGVSGVFGITAPSGITVPPTAASGNTVELTVSPPMGAELASVSIPGIALNEIEKDRRYSFVMPPHDVIIEAVFNPVDFTIDADPAVTVIRTAHYNDPVEFDVDVPVGYELTSMTLDGRPMDMNKRSFTMPADDIFIAVTFAQIDFSITADELVDVAETAHYNETVEFTVDVPTGMRIGAVTVNGSSPENRGDAAYGFTMPADDVRIRVTFSPVDYTIDAPDTVDVRGTAHYGDEIVFSVNVPEGKRTVSVKADGRTLTPDGDTYTFTMPARNVIVTAMFETVRYTISQDSVTDVPEDAAYGDKVEFTVTIPDGQRIKTVNVSGDVEVTDLGGGRYSFIMPAEEVTVDVVFEPVPDDGPGDGIDLGTVVGCTAAAIALIAVALLIVRRS